MLGGGRAPDPALCHSAPFLLLQRGLSEGFPENQGEVGDEYKCGLEDISLVWRSPCCWDVVGLKSEKQELLN